MYRFEVPSFTGLSGFFFVTAIVDADRWRVSPSSLTFFLRLLLALPLRVLFPSFFFCYYLLPRFLCFDRLSWCRLCRFDTSLVTETQRVTGSHTSRPRSAEPPAPPPPPPPRPSPGRETEPRQLRSVFILRARRRTRAAYWTDARPSIISQSSDGHITLFGSDEKSTKVELELNLCPIRQSPFVPISTSISETQYHNRYQTIPLTHSNTKKKIKTLTDSNSLKLCHTFFYWLSMRAFRRCDHFTTGNIKWIDFLQLCLSLSSARVIAPIHERQNRNDDSFLITVLRTTRSLDGSLVKLLALWIRKKCPPPKKTRRYEDNHRNHKTGVV